jgi:RNA polymerase sigma-70 factor (ECF subfamily)
MFLSTILAWRRDAKRRALFERVMREHGGALSRVAVAYAPPGPSRQDLEQEIALGVWEALPGWKEDASLKTFLFRVAHNRCIDACRKRRPEDPTGFDPEAVASASASPEALAGARARLGRVQACVRALPLAQRQALTLKLEGLSHAEIGEVMGLTANHVGVLVHRARTTLREQVQEDA